jgi:transcription antitermination factor NusG
MVPKEYLLALDWWSPTEESKYSVLKCVLPSGPEINTGCGKKRCYSGIGGALLEKLSPTQMLTQSLTPGVAKFEEAPLSLGSEAWFAVFTSSHHEKKVVQHFLQQRIENFLPLYSEIHHWTNRRKVAVQLPLFPNYVFVRIERGQRGRVLQVPGVLSLVGCGYDPTPLPDSEIEWLRSGLHLRNFEPHPYLVVGERVRIKAGTLAGMEGILLRKKNNLRVVLTVASIKQSVAVEVDAQDVEPVATRQQPGC